jgi:hypothetical protein
VPTGPPPWPTRRPARGRASTFDGRLGWEWGWGWVAAFPDHGRKEQRFIAAADGDTPSKTPEPVPGGLLGLVNPKDFEPPVREVLELVLENGFTGVNATLELARSASEITLNSNDLLGEHGVALDLPVKVHLENSFLGSSCYVGSASHPLEWELTTGETNPPAPNKPIHGTSGEANTLEEGRIATLTGTELVENAWAAPKAEGCGGLLEAAVNPVVAVSIGQTTAGHNSVTLNNEVTVDREALIVDPLRCVYAERDGRELLAVARRPRQPPLDVIPQLREARQPAFAARGEGRDPADMHVRARALHGQERGIQR